MKPTRELILEIGETLIGTCQSLDDVLACHGLTFDDIPQSLLEELDNNAMECQGCGWWCEPCELNEDQYCTDCEG